MKHFNFVLVVFTTLLALSCFTVAADPRIGPVVHIPQSNESADIEDKCSNCVSKVMQDADGNLQTGYYSRTYRVPYQFRSNVWHSNASLEDTNCTLVDPDNGEETQVEFWRLSRNYRACDEANCFQVEKLVCSSDWQVVYPE